MRKLSLGIIPLLGLFGFNSPSFSQDTLKVNPVFEIGRVISKNTRGITAGIYFYNSKFQLGYVVEQNNKGHPSHPGKGLDILKLGIEADYFPLKSNAIRPFIGSELKYEHESCFVGRENEYYTQKGVGLELKIGTELKPFRNRKIRAFVETGYTFLSNKKSEGYPENPEVTRDKFLAVLGIKF